MGGDSDFASYFDEFGQQTATSRPVWLESEGTHLELAADLFD